MYNVAYHTEAADADNAVDANFNNNNVKADENNDDANDEDDNDIDDDNYDDDFGDEKDYSTITN